MFQVGYERYNIKVEERDFVSPQVLKYFLNSFWICIYFVQISGIFFRSSHSELFNVSFSFSIWEQGIFKNGFINKYISFWRKLGCLPCSFWKNIYKRFLSKSRNTWLHAHMLNSLPNQGYWSYLYKNSSIPYLIGRKPFKKKSGQFLAVLQIEKSKFRIHSSVELIQRKWVELGLV